MKQPEVPVGFLAAQPSVKELLVPAGTVIYDIGAECPQLYILKSGQVRVYRPGEDGRSITLYSLVGGESCVLTASCILNSVHFPAIAEVESEAVCWAIPGENIKQWMSAETQWQQYMFALLSQRMSELISLVDGLAFSNLDSRLAGWLLEHSRSNQTVATTHQIVAEELASSREVISRLLKTFERDGLIKLGRGYIQVLDRKTLACLK